MNKIQKNYRKQINKSVKNLERKAKRGEGPLSNNLYRLRFYNNSSTEESKPNIVIRFIKLIFRLIRNVIIFIICSIYFLFLTIATINFLKNYIL